MEWTQVLTIIMANLVMFLWLRSEASEDRRELNGMLNAMKEETKDFHGRLISLEERYLKLKEKK